MPSTTCTECGGDLSSLIIDPDCETCYKRHRRMYRRGLVSDYPATTAYRDALGSNCPCGTGHLDLNMGCKACQYRHYWWYLQGYDFSLWVAYREQRTEYACMECPTINESIPTPGCLGCYERMVNTGMYKVCRASMKDMLNYAGGRGATVDVCNVCCAPATLFTPGCVACVRAHQTIGEGGRTHTPKMMYIMNLRIRSLGIEVFLTDKLAPLEVEAHPYKPPRRADSSCGECGGNVTHFTKGCATCETYHKKRWRAGKPTAYAEYLNYQHLIEDIHTTCGGVTDDGRACPSPLHLYMPHCKDCKKRWVSKSKTPKKRTLRERTTPVYPTPEHAVIFALQYRNTVEANAWAKITNFPAPRNGNRDTGLPVK